MYNRNKITRFSAFILTAILLSSFSVFYSPSFATITCMFLFSFLTEISEEDICLQLKLFNALTSPSNLDL